MTPLVARALDWCFAVECGPGPLRAEIGRLLRPLAAAGRATSHYRIVEQPTGGRRLHLELDDRIVGSSDEEQAILNLLVWSINQEVSARATGHVLVHAGCVADGDRAVLLVGPSGAGKSTLTTGLVLDGLAYVTDEAVALSIRDGVVHPYPRCITLKPGSWPVLPQVEPPDGGVVPPFTTDQWHLDPSDLGVVATSNRIRPAAVVLVRHEPDAPTALDPVSRGRGLQALLHQVLNRAQIDETGLSALRDAVLQTDVYELTFSSLRPAVDRIGSVVRADPRR